MLTAKSKPAPPPIKAGLPRWRAKRYTRYFADATRSASFSLCQD
jgi:hypothetical protein